MTFPSVHHVLCMRHAPGSVHFHVEEFLKHAFMQAAWES